MSQCQGTISLAYVWMQRKGKSKALAKEEVGLVCFVFKQVVFVRHPHTHTQIDAAETHTYTGSLLLKKEQKDMFFLLEAAARRPVHILSVKKYKRSKRLANIKAA